MIYAGIDPTSPIVPELWSVPTKTKSRQKLNHRMHLCSKTRYRYPRKRRVWPLSLQYLPQLYTFKMKIIWIGTESGNTVPYIPNPNSSESSRYKSATQQVDEKWWPHHNITLSRRSQSHAKVRLRMRTSPTCGSWMRCRLRSKLRRLVLKDDKPHATVPLGMKRTCMWIVDEMEGWEVELRRLVH